MKKVTVRTDREAFWKGEKRDMRIVDLTHTVKENMPVYPGTEPPRLQTVSTCERDMFKETKLSMYSHTGTHIDAPAHVFADKRSLDAFPASQFMGQALVIDCTALREGEEITMAQLAPYGDRVAQAEFLLFHLGWDEKWGTDAYFGDYPCLGEDVMELILAGNYKGIGFDVIGLDPVRYDQLKRHRILFSQKEIINIENLCNLGLCGKELFLFACLPLKFENADGAPARAVAYLT